MERNYESMVAVRTELSDEQLENIFSKISNKIETLGGKVSEARIWAKERPFSYPLRSKAAGRKRFEKGSYWLVDFRLDTEKLAELKEVIRLEENILRNIIIRKDKI
ncbi:MAG: 30S ribosomal protein S6 [Candidatus Omnitrophota bacterium]